MLACVLCAAGRASEPVLGGPCEGCELVFAGMPDDPAPTARIAPAGERGETLVIEGTVRTLDHAPAAGIIVYAYHTDSNGVYPRGTTRHGRLRGWARTDENGNYRFDTIRPGSYPGGNDPSHVHMHVIEPGTGTYFIDDLVFDDDPLLSAEERDGSRPRRGGSGVAHPVRDDAGVWHARRDIALGENVPGYTDAFRRRRSGWLPPRVLRDREPAAPPPR
jgi:protocatechuate 3,4-dioxygenase beta subunit